MKEARKVWDRINEIQGGLLSLHNQEKADDLCIKAINEAINAAPVISELPQQEPLPLDWRDQVKRAHDNLAKNNIDVTHFIIPWSWRVHLLHALAEMPYEGDRLFGLPFTFGLINVPVASVSGR